VRRLLHHQPSQRDRILDRSALVVVRACEHACVRVRGLDLLDAAHSAAG
jgi:hypothetical protein